MVEEQEAVRPVWSEEDEAWLVACVVQPLHGTARRHGRAVFEAVMRAGLAGTALTRLHGVGNRLGTSWRQEVVGAAVVLQQLTDRLLGEGLAAKGITEEAFLNCREEVERIGALISAVPEVTGGRIVLPH